MRLGLILVLALASGTAVAQTGLIAFVGLAAPHLVRSLVRAAHAWLLLLSSLMGGVLLMAADLLARALIARRFHSEESWAALAKLGPVVSCLDLSGCTGLTSLDQLAGLHQLEVLNVEGCAGLTSLDPLAGLHKLERLHLSRCTGLSRIMVDDFKRHHPKCEVLGP
jgi:hypothetical protein